jgi:hypothetical protein
MATVKSIDVIVKSIDAFDDYHAVIAGNLMPFDDAIPGQARA